VSFLTGLTGYSRYYYPIFLMKMGCAHKGRIKGILQNKHSAFRSAINHVNPVILSKTFAI